MNQSDAAINYQPVAVGRPPFRHRYEVFSPKLERRITLYSWDAVLVWTLIEGVPEITQFCERPGLIQEQNHWRLADFWLEHTGHSEYWLLPDLNLPIIGSAPRIDLDAAQAIQRVVPDHLNQHAMFIRNWQSALPYVISNRRWISAQQCDRITTFCSDVQMLVDIERSELPADPVITRTVVFDLARRGALRSEDMDRRPLSAASRFMTA